MRVAADGGANRLLGLDESIRQQGLQSRYVCAIPHLIHAASFYSGRQTDKTQENLDVIIGDLDSLDASARQYYTTLDRPAQVIRQTDQESTDFGKAVSWVRSHHGSSADIVALGGLGGRVDQGLSQLHHLYLFQPGPGYESGRVFLLSGEALTFMLKPGKHAIHVREGEGESGGGGGSGEDVFGKHVGIIPIGEPSVISTKGLEWDVEDWETRFGGNISTSNHVLEETRVVHVETTRSVLFTIALAEPR